MQKHANLNSLSCDCVFALLRACSHLSDHSQWRTRGMLLSTTRRMFALTRTDDLWIELCLCLEADEGVYCPRTRWAATWRDQFFALWNGVRARWQRAVAPPSDFNIGVCVRFRPAPDARDEDNCDENNSSSNNNNSGTKGGAHRVVIPLHQRLKMITMAHGCGPEDARRRLWQCKNEGKAMRKRRGENGAQPAPALVRESSNESAASTSISSSDDLTRTDMSRTDSLPRFSPSGRPLRPRQGIDPWVACHVHTTPRARVLGHQSQRHLRETTGSGHMGRREPREHQHHTTAANSGSSSHVSASGATTLTTTTLAAHSAPVSKPPTAATIRQDQRELCEEAMERHALIHDSSLIHDDAELAADSRMSAKSREAEEHFGTARVGVLTAHGQRVVLCAPHAGLRVFDVERVLDTTSSQLEVYNVAARRVVCEFLNGQNGCLFCYGQTGSGKTHTMFGPDVFASTSLLCRDSAGLVPRVCREVLDAVDNRRTLGIQSSLDLCYVEVFGESISDLLDNGRLVGTWHGIAARSVLQGLVKVRVDGRESLEEMLAIADSAKRRAATEMNARSSRAHALLFLFLNQTRGDVTHTSQLCLCDLGGSEQLKKSGASGERLREAIQINLGLLALKKCIQALSEISSGTADKERVHVPYSSSVLTTLLQGALGGGCNTVVIVNGSMDPAHTTETMHALRFGERCSTVHSSVLGSRVMLDNAAVNIIATLNQQIKELEETIRSREHWENVVTTRVDEASGRIETITTSKLVGADDLRTQYEQLLRVRTDLIGS